jgi:hypothetical protein
MTDAQPLVAQAHGTSRASPASTLASPNGNGMPMKNASGAMSAAEITILSESASPTAFSNSQGSTLRQSAADSAIAATTARLACRSGGALPSAKRFEAALPIPANSRNANSTTATA